MLKNYLTLALRNVRKHPAFAVINVLGLALGTAASLLVYCWVADELSYDRFHPNASQLFRISNKIDEKFYISTPTQLSDYLQEETAGVKLTADTQWSGQQVLVRHRGEMIEEEFLHVEPEFLQMFDFPLIAGVDSLALSRPHTLLLTPEMVEKYFPASSPLGQRLLLTDSTEYEIIGVVAAPPGNSSIQFDFLTSTAGQENMHLTADNGWLGGTGFTYVLTEPGYTKEQLMGDIASITDRYDAPDDIWHFTVELLPEVHLHSDFGASDGVQGDIRYVYSFLAVGALILCIACFNYINLTTARSMERAREVGIRKASGALRGQLVGQFLGESLLTTTAATVIGYGLAYLALPTLNTLSHKELSLNLWKTPHLLGAMLALLTLITALAALYPAVAITTFRPVDALRNRATSSGGQSAWLRQGLVIFQFATSALLVIGTVVIWRQLAFIRHYDLGFDQQQLIKIEHPQVTYDQFATIKNELTAVRGVVGVTSAPLQHYSNSWFVRDDSLAQDLDMNGFSVEADFFELLDVEVTEGRSFRPDSPADLRHSVILSPEAVTAFGLENPVGKIVKVMTQNYQTNKYEFTEKEVIGVLSDQVHFQSLKEAPKPFVVQSGTYLSNVLVKVATDNMSATLELVRARWETLNPNLPFDYSLVDDTYSRLYQQDQRLGQLFGLFSGVALFIAGLGLIGLAAYATQQRTKEIGVRKVLGASVSQLIWLLSTNTVRLMVISLVIAIPVANYLAQEWLALYHTCIELTGWIYGLPAVVMLLLALLAVSSQTLRAATRNPVDSLRDE